MKESGAGTVCSVVMELLITYSCQIPKAIAWDERQVDDFDGLRDNIFRLAYSLTLNYTAAEDLAQDCLIRVWQNRQRLKEVDSPKAWVAQIVINRARSHWRKQPRWLPFARAEAVTDELDPNLLALRHAMEKLPADCREIALLIGVYGASYAEAAASTGIPEGTVASRYHRAKNLLKEALA